MGNSKKHLESAIQKISAKKNISLTKCSHFYLTKAWGKTDQQNFINSVIEITTNLTPKTLLATVQNIENSMGRQRCEKWGPRIIDIDILLYNDIVVKQPQLTIPHPYILQRSFVLAPLFELNKELVIPNKGRLQDFIHQESLDRDIIKVL